MISHRKYELLKDYPSTSGEAYLTTQKSGDQVSSWIFDCGATDTMTYEPSDFVSTKKPNRTHIKTANGESASVKEEELSKYLPI
ncbi:hypothetical protein HanRHA438_Chr17g0833631 [Helianthus annuus]|nr:hypothetical protein HanRHA438_Chr17g0833631 [Helianthus annuus]